MNEFQTPKPLLQIGFYRRLEELRRIHLLDALLETVSRLNIPQIDSELSKFVDPESLRKMASRGLRGELVFPVPSILNANPKILGYYRLLLGLSKKEFYGRKYGFGRFRTIEEDGRSPSAFEADLPMLCRALCRSGRMLISSIEELTENVIHELTLLTLGAQLRGEALNIYGERSVDRVFRRISSILGHARPEIGERTIEVVNAAGRTVVVRFANDPDISIQEILPSGKRRNILAVEIKGGRDVSNVHNRIGEAEKSHQKAKKLGFTQCWTIVGIPDINQDLAKRESPSTDKFYFLDSILDEESDDGQEFREAIQSLIGISDSSPAVPRN